MRLHEYYFENMTKNKFELNKDSVFYKKIQVAKKLFNTWINERDVGHLSACPIILIMDVFEHAFMIDYGLKRADYIEAFLNAIDWSIVIS
jgi:Fe-Mn family superoxide dismutase